jgi:hypothetical protein
MTPERRDGWDMICSRCRRIRWVESVPDPADAYFCLRCQTYLAARHAVATPPPDPPLRQWGRRRPFRYWRQKP